MKKQRVAILGASDNKDRYSYKAMKMLEQHGHEVVLVSARLDSIEGHKVFHDLKDLAEIDTLTMYVGDQVSTRLADEIVKLRPGRVIFNPGSENNVLVDKLDQEHIPYENACTLVLLSTDQF